MILTLDDLKNDQKIFWSKLIHDETTDCWEWGQCLGHNGYGIFRVGKKFYKTHRLSAWLSEMIDTPIAPPRHRQDIRALVLHHCDNPKCCNPKHLWIGNTSENLKDCYAKNRRKSPMTNPNYRYIRDRYRDDSGKQLPLFNHILTNER